MASGALSVAQGLDYRGAGVDIDAGEALVEAIKPLARATSRSGVLGGLGGFVLPIIFGALVDLTGVRSSAFMFLFAMTSFSLVLMLASTRREKKRHRLRLVAEKA